MAVPSPPSPVHHPSGNAPTKLLPPGFACALDGTGWASDYAGSLLTLLGATVLRGSGKPDEHPAMAWARSGAMTMTGRADGPPQVCPLPLASCVSGVAVAFAALVNSAGHVLTSPLPGAETLGERAVLSGLRRSGAISAGGACRLLRAADDWLALSLPRADDWQLMAAWLECDFPTNGNNASDLEIAWQRLAILLRERLAATLIERARLLGLAVARAATMPFGETRVPWYEVVHVAASHCTSNGSVHRRRTPPLVIDLSSLWAGPLCSHILQSAGARVIKVESMQRPDGARLGAAEFYDLLNHGKASVALDFASPRGIEQLRQLLLKADIVIEASRPRALRQLGIQAEQILAANPGLTWLAISGHGRVEPQANWIAYGDDAGVAAGLSGVLLDLTGEPLFCGDAIADPLTGWHAALAALAGYYSGGGCLISLALVDVVKHCSQFRQPASRDAMQERWREWQQRVEAGATIVMPSVRHATVSARPLGTDTGTILMELGIPC